MEEAIEGTNQGFVGLRMVSNFLRNFVPAHSLNPKP